MLFCYKAERLVWYWILILKNKFDLSSQSFIEILKACNQMSITEKLQAGLHGDGRKCVKVSIINSSRGISKKTENREAAGVR